MTEKIDDNIIKIKFCRDLYPKEAVIKAAYCFIDRCYIHLDQTNTDYSIEFIPKEGFTIDDIKNDFNNELLAQAVRYYVYKQTHVIREILLARAMASTIIDECADYELEEQDTNLEDIVMDWFEKYGQDDKSL